MLAVIRRSLSPLRKPWQSHYSLDIHSLFSFLHIPHLTISVSILQCLLLEPLCLYKKLGFETDQKSLTSSALVFQEMTPVVVFADVVDSVAVGLVVPASVDPAVLVAVVVSAVVAAVTIAVAPTAAVVVVSVVAVGVAVVVSVVGRVVHLVVQVSAVVAVAVAEVVVVAVGVFVVDPAAAAASAAAVDASRFQYSRHCCSNELSCAANPFSGCLI